MSAPCLLTHPSYIHFYSHGNIDETVVNGAQSFYKKQFGIGDPESERDSWLLGLTNSAPYLCCAVLGCWLTEPMNKYFGRRGTIWISCLVSALACLWQAFTNNWWHMFIARFVLGLGIGPKSATTRPSAPLVEPRIVDMSTANTSHQLSLPLSAHRPDCAALL